MNLRKKDLWSHIYIPTVLCMVDIFQDIREDQFSHFVYINPEFPPYGYASSLLFPSQQTRHCHSEMTKTSTFNKDAFLCIIRILSFFIYFLIHLAEFSFLGIWFVLE